MWIFVYYNSLIFIPYTSQEEMQHTRVLILFFVSSDTIFFCFLFPVTWWSMGKMELPVCCFVVTFFLIEEIDLLLMLGAEEPEIQTRYNFSRLVLCLYTQCCRFCFAFCFAFARLITIFTVLLVSVDFKTFARHGRFPSP